MNELANLQNIGKALAATLETAGITNEKELKKIGSRNALIKLMTINKNDVCINMLYAIEGAIRGIRWHHLDKDVKKELKEFFSQINCQNVERDKG